jgi:hypothetical protein
VNTSRTCSARRVNARSQPRTVDAGRPSLQRQPDHLPGISPPGQAPRRQQHMRHPAPTAPGPARQQPHMPVRPVQPARQPHPPPDPPAPPGQHAPARRAGQLPAPQLPFDHVPVSVYREHDASARQPSGPPVSGCQDEETGGPHPCPT